MFIGIFAFPYKLETLAFVQDAMACISASGHAYALCSQLASALNMPYDEPAYNAVSLMVAAGGDGAFLAAQQHAGPRGISVLCVHLGRVGYLSEARPEAWREAYDAALDGSAAIEDRLMLSASVEGETIGHALNDVVLNRVGRRILSFEVHAGEQALGRYAADGLIIATPTGSTAYALSCGGPIVHPDVACIILAPISPHTISARPFVLPVSQPLRVTVLDPPEGAMLAMDGQGDRVVRAGEVLTACLSPHKARFIRTRPRNFYRLLREKLTELS